MEIAHVGAFSMPNWGDKLYPGTLRSLLAEVGVDAAISYFCPVPGRTSDGEPIGSLSDLRRSRADAVLVGGGDILRFDNRTVAMDHLSVATDRRRSPLARARAKVFVKRRLLAGPGAWAPLEPWISDTPSVLLSAGVHTVPDNDAARRAVTNYRAAWVRTQDGADRLAGAGLPRERLILAPDMIFALPDLLTPEAVRQRGESILRDRVGGADLPLVFHAAQFHGWPLERVRAALESLDGLPVVTLSLGSYAGEDRLLAAGASPRGLATLHDLSAPDITAVLAAAGAVFTTSMHAAIVAASFGTAVLVPGVGKTRDAFAVTPQPPTLHGVDDATLGAVAHDLLGKRLPHSTETNRAAVVSALEATLRAADLL